MCRQNFFLSWGTTGRAKVDKKMVRLVFQDVDEFIFNMQDSFSEALLSFGANSVSMDEHDDYEDSDEVSICSIFAGDGDVTSCISYAADSIGIEMPIFEHLKYDPYDWIKRTQYVQISTNECVVYSEVSMIIPHCTTAVSKYLKAYATRLSIVILSKEIAWEGMIQLAKKISLEESFDPVEVTTGLWVVPEWKTPPDARATNIILNPGLAFGTGEHATTKMCLLLLHQTVQGGENFLDYGTGSGILSIAALKLGAALSVGVDIDPQAITAARQNAELNNIEPEKLKLYLVSSEDSASLVDEKVQEDMHAKESAAEQNSNNTNEYDIVIANILLNPLLALADEIVSHAKVGATVGLSGILNEQVSSVIERYSPILEDISVSEMEDWACIKGKKKVAI
ncbi:uncharacterized protein LOC104891486 isoform X2 [Beta vulgaris subsp. vulgaris]|uniref:uncharacterized protein LOC104891486 isoform X2 n=1 Tax=Beta vulgaris subsp. vulgaris TaxID=3555 RepID=UPI0020374DF1|nr:uncharacterized protein LOC104891486 isoform X2 [Beta vulgaris subsp. vulgaris]XP_048498762.1 uncharacterized protein LOC104891486 isoform X2 [Beta vulgaris subsp. vulgaris]